MKTSKFNTAQIQLEIQKLESKQTSLNLQLQTYNEKLKRLQQNVTDVTNKIKRLEAVRAGLYAKLQQRVSGK